MNATKKRINETMEVWSYTSTFLKWSIIIIGSGTIPILLYTLYRVFTVYRKSQYFLFLSTILTLDLILLSTIIYNVMVDFVPFLRHDVFCPITAYISTATSSHSNWLSVCMYVQRYFYVFYPMSIVKSSRIWRIIYDSRRLIIYTGIISYTSQSWLLILMRHQYLYDEDDENNKDLSFCGADLNRLSVTQYYYLSLLELGISYGIPFVITIVADFAVIFNKIENNTFTIVSSETMTSKGFSLSETSSFFKIQSEESIKAMNLRRRKNIRRCLIIVTIQVLLNLPCYIVQFLPEVIENDIYPVLQHPIYLYADAISYFVYLVQFPLKALFVDFLHPNWVRRA